MEKVRNVSIDILRGIAILTVVFTHLPGNSLRYNALIWWFYAFFVNMAVPVFMILMGYCSLQSAEKRDSSLSSLYSLPHILRKLRRYLLPWVPVVIIEFLAIYLGQGNFTPASALEFIAAGGAGPGNYYIPILFQFVFVFPLLYLVRHRILIITLVLNLAFELAAVYFHIPMAIYRVCIMRYLFLIGCGMHMYHNAGHCYSKLTQISVTVFGTAYLMFMSIFLDYGRTYPSWWSTWMLVGLYLYFPVRYIITSGIFDKFASSFTGKIIIRSSVASFHIFLLQMFYYFFMHFLQVHFQYSAALSAAVTALGAFPVCVLGGIGYCKLESKLFASRKK